MPEKPLLMPLSVTEDDKGLKELVGYLDKNKDITVCVAVKSLEMIYRFGIWCGSHKKVGMSSSYARLLDKQGGVVFALSDAIPEGVLHALPMLNDEFPGMAR